MAFPRVSPLPCSGSSSGERVRRGERTFAPPASPGDRGARATPPRRGARSLGVGLVVAAALALPACEPYVEGNGVFLEEVRDVAPFTGIHVEDEIKVTLTAGTAQQSLRVSGDANLLQYVKTEVLEETVQGTPTKVLHVSVDAKDFDPAIPVSAVVHVGALRYVFATEEASVTATGAATQTMVVDARAGSRIVLAGAGGTSIQATLDDADLDAGSYPVQLASVTLTNASRVELHADAGVTGTADAASVVDNLLGDGACDVPVAKLCCAPALACP